MRISDWSSDVCSSDLLEVPAEPVVATQLEIAIDALDIAAVRPFWEAVLGYRSDEGDEVVDPFGRGPAFWFQQMEERKSDVEGKSVSVRVDLGGRRIMKQNNKTQNQKITTTENK